MTAPHRAAQNGAATVTERAAPTSRADILNAILDATEFRESVAPLLLPRQTFDQVSITIKMAVRDNPAILECTAGSIRQAVGRALQMGLEIGVTVHLVPFNVKVSKRGEPDRWEKRLSAIPDYKGLIQLMVGAGSIRHIEPPQVVYEGDTFEEVLGSEKRLTHVPCADPAKRGKIRGAYVFYRVPFGYRDHLYMPVAEIEAIRANSKQYSKGELPPWYAKKCPIRQLAKYQPLKRTSRLARAIELDEEQEFGGTPEAETAPETPMGSEWAEERTAPEPEAAAPDAHTDVDWQDDRDLVEES